MKSFPQRMLLISSLLLAPFGCNSQVQPGARATTGPSTLATTRPVAHVAPTTLEVRGITATTAPTTQAIVADLKRNLTLLASDEFEGRGVGTGGIDKAAALVESNFRAAGLKPLPGMADYFQKFEMTTAESVGDETKLKSSAGEYSLRTQFTATSFSGEKAFDGPVVFVGYGITSAEQKYDDYAGINAKGKVVIAMRFEPHDGKGRSRFAKDNWSDAARLDVKAENAAKHGAAALLLVNPMWFHGEEDPLLPFARHFKGGAAPIPVLHVKQTMVEQWLQQAGAPNLKALQETIDSKGAPASLELKNQSVSGNVAINRKVSEVKNVVGYLPGHGPHADEFVIVGAHYDHLGYGGMGSLAPGAKEIHHGADDNASGTTTVLELAKLMGSASPLDRSVIFVTFTGEEWGLVGSQYFVTHPPVPLAKVAAMLNLDMVGRLRGNTLYVGGAGTAAPLESILNDCEQASGIKCRSIGKGGMGPSDHMSFALAKVPVLFFFTGMHEDYHRPTDTADKINFDGMHEIVVAGDRVIQDMAAMPKPQYVSASDNTPLEMGLTGSPSGAHVQLGVVPSYGGEEPAHGVRITGVVDKSPAALAGLKGGDVLLAVGDKTLDSLYDLSAVLARSKAGEVVSIRVQRDKQELTVQATLTERK